LAEQRIHIVAFDVPYPPDYGGVIDIFYKIKALHAEGVKVILHAYTYRNRGPARELEAYCEAVHYYPRDLSSGHLFRKIPFIVASRMHKSLVSNIISQPAPVLLEGWHTCGILGELKQAGLLVGVREHNIESRYYSGLAKVAHQKGRRLYYAIESRKLAAFEPGLARADHIFAISPKDEQYLSALFPNVSLLPVFHATEAINAEPGIGDFALYHGNLGVEENSAAVAWLLNEVWHSLDFPLVIAGKNAPDWLRKMIKIIPAARLEEDTSRLEALIRDAHIHVLPAMQDTGIKLKLLHALFAGRHCLVNPAMVAGTGLEPLCHIADEAGAWRKQINALRKVSFNAAEIENRSALLLPAFDNRANARKLMASSYLLPS
jgi:hypothetical protein